MGYAPWDARGWAEKTAEEVKAEMERLAGGANLDSYEKEITQLRKRAETLRDDLASYLPVVVEAPGLETERATLSSISTFKFGRHKTGLRQVEYAGA